MKAEKLGLMVVLFALGIIIYALPYFSLNFTNMDDLLTFIILVIFLYIVKKYPLGLLQNRQTSFEFPILYACVVNYGFIETALIFSFIIFIQEARRWFLKVYLFQICNFIISLFSAYYISTSLVPFSTTDLSLGLLHFIIFLLVYTLINQSLLDILLWLQPQPYTRTHWLEKWRMEVLVLIVSLCYGFLFHLFLSQGRTEDVFGYFFFYLPIAALSVIIFNMNMLIRQKKKLETMLYASKKMNESIDKEEILQGIQEAISQVIGYSFGIIYIKNNHELVASRVFGYRVDELRNAYLAIGSNVTSSLLELKESMLFHKIQYDEKSQHNRSDGNEFKMTSVLVMPIIIENEVIGAMVVGKDRPSRFYEEDETLLQTLANQASAAIKNYRLIRESERRIIVEERNRLAREIHDGLAQSIAAVAMQLESSVRFFDKEPAQVKVWMEESLKSLRISLRDIRQSIYALKPSPLGNQDLFSALKAKIVEFQQATGITGEIVVKGEVRELPTRIEEALYLILSEALQNIYKHAQATNVNVILSYHKEMVEMMICDDGIGFMLNEVLKRNRNEKHFGILNMNELVSKNNGSFDINSNRGNGTEITINIPFTGYVEGIQE